PSKRETVGPPAAPLPARAPASMDMLHTVMRPSIDNPRIALPRYSITLPMPPAVPSRLMIASTMSLAVTPSGVSPSTVTASVAGRAPGQRRGARPGLTPPVPPPTGHAAAAPGGAGSAGAPPDRRPP